MKLLLRIRYNGAGFAGYQFQPDKRTVQGCLTDAFSRALGRRVSVTGCSRTDAGVHALGFVCAVEPVENHGEDWLKIPVGKFHRAAQRFLPDDIGISGEALSDDSFHPRYSVKSKTYIYRMYDSPAADPFLSGRAWQLKKPVSDEDLDRINLCGERLIGRHDYTSFMAAGSKITDAVREIYSLSVSRETDGMICLKITADGFLYNMVRIITGTLMDGQYSPEDITRILESRDRRDAGKTAPPDGLYLYEVNYDPQPEWVLL